MKGYSPIIEKDEIELNSKLNTSFIELGSIETKQMKCDCENCKCENCKCRCHD